MNIQDILNRAFSLRIAVIGDLILDRYIDGVMERISPEAPVPVLRLTGTRENPGGAGNVVENLKGLGCEVSFFRGVHVPIKTRVMSGTHHIIRIDEEEQPEWMRWDDIDIGLGYGIEHQKFNCVVISDYNKGTISADVAKNVIELCRQHEIPIVVDTKHQQHIFQGASVLKCNRHEWDAYTKKQVKFLDTKFFMAFNDIDNLVITDGGRGMQYHGVWGGNELHGNILGLPVSISDSCGAGDTVTAVLAIMEALGEAMDDACELANQAAAYVCTQPGVYAIKKEDLIKHHG